MAEVHHSVLGLLVTVLYLNVVTGVSGETLPKTSRVGGDVSLPCTNVVHPDCSSTTWNFNRAGTKTTIEEFQFGNLQVQKTERAERLSLGSNCSLHVSDVRAEDAGLYTCQQFLVKGESQYGGDANVHLSVLTDSSDVTTLIPVKTTTSTPQQYETGSTASTARPALSTTSPSSIGPPINQTPIPFLVLLGSLTLILTMGVAVGAAVCVAAAAAAVIIVCRRRTKTQMKAEDSISLYTVKHSTPPTNEETSQPADRITYASIEHFNQNPTQRVDVQGEDAVTYSSVMPSSTRETENPADPSSLYSTVNQP